MNAPPHPEIEAAWVAGRPEDSRGLLSIVVDGKTHSFYVPRAKLFGLMAQCAEALKKMEPGS